MGAQSYLIKDQESYYDEALKTMMKSADTFYAREHFRIGDKVDYDKLRHAQLLERILCTESCELIDYIYKKIAGTLENKKSKKPHKKIKREEDDERTIIINNFNDKNYWEEILW